MKKPRSKFHDRPVQFSCNAGQSLSRLMRVDATWGQFGRLVLKVARTNETLDQYSRLSQEQKDKLKGARGWITAGPYDTEYRRSSSAQSRKVLAYDLDNLTNEQYSQIKNRNSHLSEYESIWHTTRSNRPDNPRVRLYLLSNGLISPDIYEAVSRILAYQSPPEK